KTAGRILRRSLINADWYKDTCPVYTNPQSDVNLFPGPQLPIQHNSFFDGHKKSLHKAGFLMY
ncbi:MAG: hypothetical protein ACW7DX_09895, partial [Paraglaciecola chathamensis]